MVYSYNGILPSLKKEENSDPCYNMDETWGNLATKNAIFVTFSESSQYNYLFQLYGGT